MQINVNTKSGPNKQQNIHSKKPILTEKDSAWFSRLLWHPARKRSASVLTTRSSHRVQLEVQRWHQYSRIRLRVFVSFFHRAWVLKP